MIDFNLNKYGVTALPEVMILQTRVRYRVMRRCSRFLLDVIGQCIISTNLQSKKKTFNYIIGMGICSGLIGKGNVSNRL